MARSSSWRRRRPSQHAGIAPAEYQARRAALAKTIGPDALLIAFSSEPARRTGDVDWPFRQEDNLLYLTGMNEPDTTLVLLPGERERREIIFARDRDPSNERWTGVIPSKEQVTASTGVRDVASPRRFNQFIDALFQGRGWDAPPQSGYFAPPAMPAFLAAVRAGRAEVWLVMHDRGALGSAMTREQRFADDLRRQYPEVRFRDASPLLLAMREIKSPAELTLIQRAIDITVEAQKAAMARVRTATRESEVQATIEFTFRNLGACCWGFPSIVAAGRNSTTLHYETNNGPIVRGGLLLTDIGAEVEGYGADVTRTYPADGTFSPEQRDIYQAVFAAQAESLALMRPGGRHLEVNNKAIEVVGRELLKLGLVTQGDARSGRPLSLSRNRPPARPADARCLRPRPRLRAGHGLHERAGHLREEGRHRRERDLQADAAGRTDLGAQRAAALRRDRHSHRRRRVDHGRRAEGVVVGRAEHGQGHRGVDVPAMKVRPRVTRKRRGAAATKSAHEIAVARGCRS